MEETKRKEGREREDNKGIKDGGRRREPEGEGVARLSETTRDRDSGSERDDGERACVRA